MYDYKLPPWFTGLHPVYINQQERSRGLAPFKHRLHTSYFAVHSTAVVALRTFEHDFTTGCLHYYSAVLAAWHSDQYQ